MTWVVDEYENRLLQYFYETCPADIFCPQLDGSTNRISGYFLIIIVIVILIAVIAMIALNSYSVRLKRLKEYVRKKNTLEERK